MQTKDEILNQIENLKNQKMQIYADFAEFFSNAKTDKRINKKDVAFYKNADNIEDFYDVDSAICERLTESHFFLAKNPFLQLLFKYKGKRSLVYINPDHFEYGYSWDEEKSYERKFDNIDEKISMLERIIN